MLAVGDNNFSDDELAYLAYFNIVYAVQKILSSNYLSSTQKEHARAVIDSILEYMKIELDLSHKYVEMGKSPLYNFIYSYASGQVNETQRLFRKYNALPFASDCKTLSIDGVWYMQRWPLELIDWPQFNSDRLDVQINTPADCNGGRHSLQMLPPDERVFHLWNANVYLLDTGNGTEEKDPTAFLIGYWGMRYFHLLA
jgi:hypothetical protein